jgi:hypothetical protein
MTLMVIARRAAALGLLSALMCGKVFGQEATTQHPHLPDADAALRVGLPILESKYGKELVAKGQPYQAVSKDDRWLIVPSLPSGMRGGGRPELSLSKRDAQVMSIGLSR